ncbi:MFS transporter [Kribbella sp. VKM Ac-2568]|uniref:MFS transporter n=1 Tax=Kribbella sp. VKM Ac-2568 TaxID=2512219 RepID=UPI00130542C6|nr:MFS transporter [Kribbella sp. VKM Ac-2568]
MTFRVRGGGRPIIATCIANAIEWYDFAVYGALASVLVAVLLRPGPGDGGLTAIFAVFATSFLARPVGALLVGMRADQVGRRRLLAATILLMAGATAAIGLLPPWSAVGVLAPMCLVVLRLVQGFASGGEISVSIAYLLESSPPRRWGYYGGWHTATIALGFTAGLTAAAVVSATLSTADLERWGWRIPFLVALPLGLAGLYIRLRLRETTPFEQAGRSADRSAATIQTAWREHAPAVWTGFALVSVLSGTFNIWFVFLPSHLVAEDIHDLPVALACAVAGLAAAAVAAPLLGLLSDRIGRRPLLVAGTSLLCLLAVPLYELVLQGSMLRLLVADLAIGILLGTLVISAHIAERFPVTVRASGIALTYGLATALIGGTAPVVASLLTEHGFSVCVPLYLLGLSAAGLTAALHSPPVVASGGT